MILDPLHVWRLQRLSPAARRAATAPARVRLGRQADAHSPIGRVIRQQTGPRRAVGMNSGLHVGCIWAVAYPPPKLPLHSHSCARAARHSNAVPQLECCGWKCWRRWCPTLCPDTPPTALMQHHCLLPHLCPGQLDATRWQQVAGSSQLQLDLAGIGRRLGHRVGHALHLLPRRDAAGSAIGGVDGVGGLVPGEFKG